MEGRFVECHPYLFVVGVPRSGTTLLQRMLDHHPQLAVSNDSHFIPRALESTKKQWLREVINGEAIPLTSELVQATRSYHRFHRMELDDRQVDQCVACSATFQQFVSSLYQTRAANHGKLYSGEKTPDYVRRIPLLNGLFPDAKFVHIVRDGRDVALSLMQWATSSKGPGRIELWNARPIAVCALWWKWLVDAGILESDRIDRHQYLEIQYDDLVQFPRRTMNKVAAFLEVPFSSEMLNYHSGRQKTGEGQSAKSAWLPPQSGLRDWRSDMSESDVELFEALAGDTLTSLGYERRYDVISTGIAEEASMCYQWWCEHFLPQYQNAAYAKRTEPTKCNY